MSQIYGMYGTRREALHCQNACNRLFCSKDNCKPPIAFPFVCDIKVTYVYEN